MPTVTRDGWHVSTSHCSTEPGVWTLRIFRPRDSLHRLVQRADHDGRRFTSQEEAAAFALARGYTQRFVSPRRARVKAVARPALRRALRTTRAAVERAQDRGEVFEATQTMRAAAIQAGADPVSALTWSNGAHAMARRLRPDLFASPGA